MTYVPPDRMNAAQALERFVRETQGGNLYDLDEEAQDRAVRPIRDMLITGQLEAWLFQEEDGHQVAVPGHRWAGRKIWEDASVGIMTTIEIDGQWVTGRVLVSRAQLEDILKDLSQISSASAPATPKPSYVPPFIRYMLELVERFDLEPGYKFDRDRMADWIS